MMAMTTVLVTIGRLPRAAPHHQGLSCRTTIRIKRIVASSSACSEFASARPGRKLRRIVRPVCPQELHEQEIGVGETNQFDIDQEIRVAGRKLGDADAPAGWRFNAEISEDALEQGDVRSRAAVQEVVAAAA